MPKIIISYRRDDSQAIAGRIRDKLAGRYGAESVFMDIDNIPYGLDFRVPIQDALQGTDILVAVIGPKWTGRRNFWRTRIREKNDPVRVELERGLERGIPVVPLLINGASIPQASELPDSLKNLVYPMRRRWMRAGIFISTCTARYGPWMKYWQTRQRPAASSPKKNSVRPNKRCEKDKKLVRGAGLDARTTQSPGNRKASPLMGGSGSASP